MMIKAILQNKIASLILVLILTLALRFGVFFILPISWHESANNGILTKFIMAMNAVPIASFLFSTAILILEGLILNKLIWDQNIIERPGYLVFYFYLIVNSCFSENYFLNNILIGNLFILIGLYYLYAFLKSNYQRNYLFIASLTMGISALCVPEHYWILIFLISTVIIFKPILPLDIFTILFGLLMPYYVISAMGYLLSQNIDFQNAWQFWVLKAKPIDFHWFKNGPDILLLIVIIIFVLTGMLQIIGSYFRSNVETRRSKLAMLVLTFYLFIVFLIKFKDYSHYFIIASIPFSILLSQVFWGQKWKKWKEFLHIILILLISYNLFRIILN